MAGKLDRIKIGIIGCGRAAENLHLPALQKMTDAEVVALADVDKACMAALADRFKSKNSTPIIVNCSNVRRLTLWRFWFRRNFMCR